MINIWQESAKRLFSRGMRYATSQKKKYWLEFADTTHHSYDCIADSDEQARALIPEEALLGFPGDVLSYGLIGSPATIRQRLAAYEAVGVQELVIGFFDSPPLDAMRRFAREFIQ